MADTASMSFLDLFFFFSPDANVPKAQRAQCVARRTTPGRKLELKEGGNRTCWCVNPVKLYNSRFQHSSCSPIWILKKRSFTKPTLQHAWFNCMCNFSGLDSIIHVLSKLNSVLPWTPRSSLPKHLYDQLLLSFSYSNTLRQIVMKLFIIWWLSRSLRIKVSQLCSLLCFQPDRRSERHYSN